MPQRDRSYYEGLLNDPRARAMLDMIAAGEVDVDGFRAGNGYDALFNGGRASDLSKHPAVSTKFYDKRRGETLNTTAAGRYQFTKTTWDLFAKSLRLTDFSARSQDIAALALADKIGALDHFLNGRFTEGVQALGRRWASMPDSKLRHGDTHSPSYFYDVYTASLRRNDPTLKYADPAPPTNYRRTSGANILDAKPTGARRDYGGGGNTGGGMFGAGGSLSIPGLNTNIDLSRIPDYSNWDADNHTSQIMFNRYGNRRILATHPGQLNDVTGTLMGAALLEPRPPVLYSPAPYPEGGTTVTTMSGVNRATPSVHPTTASPAAQASQSGEPAQPVASGTGPGIGVFTEPDGTPTFYSGDTPYFPLEPPAGQGTGTRDIQTTAPNTGQTARARVIDPSAPATPLSGGGTRRAAQQPAAQPAAQAQQAPVTEASSAATKAAEKAAEPVPTSASGLGLTPNTQTSADVRQPVVMNDETPSQTAAQPVAASMPPGVSSGLNDIFKDPRLAGLQEPATLTDAEKQTLQDVLRFLDDNKDRYDRTLKRNSNDPRDVTFKHNYEAHQQLIDSVARLAPPQRTGILAKWGSTPTDFVIENWKKEPVVYDPEIGMSPIDNMLIDIGHRVGGTLQLNATSNLADAAVGRVLQGYEDMLGAARDAAATYLNPTNWGSWLRNWGATTYGMMWGDVQATRAANPIPTREDLATSVPGEYKER